MAKEIKWTNDFTATLVARMDANPMLETLVVAKAHDNGNYRSHVVKEVLEQFVISNVQAGGLFMAGYDEPNTVIDDWIKLGIESVDWKQVADYYMDKASLKYTDATLVGN